MKNFAFNIVGAEQRNWNIDDFIDQAIEEIKQKTGDHRIIIATSGGVDSTVGAILAQKALGNDKLLCVHVDTGLMRKNESQSVLSDLRNLGLNVKCVDASEEFFHALKGIVDSDEKRKAVGETFIRVFEKEAKEFDADYLLQATIAPDFIESTRGQAKCKVSLEHGGYIKIHHNVGALPEDMELILVEPLRSLFKYQVRLLAEKLNLPRASVERQPQPGPSAAVRIAGSITCENVRLWQEVNDYVEHRLSSFNPTQFFSVLIPNEYELNSNIPDEIEKIVKESIRGKYIPTVKMFKYRTVGVKGDERVYGRAVGLGLHGEDGKLRLDELEHIDLLNLQAKITGSVSEVVRVCMLLSDQPNFMERYAVILRAIETRDFMTATPKFISWALVREIDNQVRNAFKDIGVTYLDYTTKPSSTIEYL